MWGFSLHSVYSNGLLKPYNKYLAYSAFWLYKFKFDSDCFSGQLIKATQALST